MSALRKFAMAALLVVSLPVVESARGETVTLPDGRHLHLNCTGSGAPTILLEGGFAADSGAWFKVQPDLAKTNRACSYDRAGYGTSDTGPMPRDGKAVASDLDLALRGARIDGPYILVGHSAGALYLRLFADARPSQIAGVVLVDPSIEYQNRRFESRFGPGAGTLEPLRLRAERCLTAALQQALPSTDPSLVPCTPRSPRPLPATSLRPDIWRTQISELDTLWDATSDEVAKGQSSYGDVPLIVLTADGTYPNVPAAEQLWWELHNEIAARSHRGSNRLVDHSSHMMTFDRPDAIIEAVKNVIKQAGTTR